MGLWNKYLQKAMHAKTLTASLLLCLLLSNGCGANRNHREVVDAADTPQEAPPAGSYTIRIHNTGSREVFLRRSCDVMIGISPVTKEWRTSTLSPCACDCADPTCTHVDCAACSEPTIVPLATGAVIDVAWLPRLSSRQGRVINGSNAICANHLPLAPGPYLAYVATFPTWSDAVSMTNLQEFELAFFMPDLPSIIKVDLP